MIILRNIIFNFLFFGASLFWSLALLWALFLPRRWTMKVLQNTYFASIAWLEKNILGLTYRLEGMDNIPASGGFVLASKHQSAYETLKYPLLFEDIAIVMKRELTWIPIWGWYPLATGQIAIDRGAAKVAMASIIRGAKNAVGDQQRPLLIFPQGTRRAIGEERKYKIGIGRIYEAVDAPVVPVALNSGLFWGKNKFWKKPGCVTIKFLPPIAPGLPVADFMEKLENQIERESDKLTSM